MITKPLQYTLILIIAFLIWWTFFLWIGMKPIALKSVRYKKNYGELHNDYSAIRILRRSLVQKLQEPLETNSSLIHLCQSYNATDPNICFVKLKCYLNETKNPCQNVSCFNCNFRYYDKQINKQIITFHYKLFEDPKFIRRKVCRFLEDYHYHLPHDTSLHGVLRCVTCDHHKGQETLSTSVAMQAFQSNCKSQSKNRGMLLGTNVTVPSIHLFYFRFFSRQEFQSKFHRTNAQLKKIQSALHADVYNFTKHQSTKIKYAEGLKQLLCGELPTSGMESGEFTCNNSLAHTAAMHGYKTYLFDHTCEESMSGTIRKLFSNFFRHADFGTDRQSHNAFNDLPRSLRDKFCQKQTSKDGEDADLSGFFDYHKILNKMEGSNGYLLFSIIRTSDISESHLDSVDKRLASVVEYLSRKKNTAVILIGDIGHGLSPPGWKNFRITQLSNPPLNIVLSKRLQASLGKEKIQNIYKNRQRLVTLKDVHRTIRDILINGYYRETDEVTFDSRLGDNEMNFGLFHPLPQSRSCAFLRVTQPHICLNENEAVPFENDSIQVGLAEFVLGRLNERIQTDIEAEQNDSGLFMLSPFGHCRRLKGITFGNIQRWWEGDQVLTQMDIHVLGKDVRNLDTLTVLLSMNDNSGVPDVKLLSYRRNMHSNSSSQICYRGNLDYDLCRCIETGAQSMASWRSAYLRMTFSKSFGVTSKVANINNQCLLLLMRDYTNSIVFEATNICEGKEYVVGLYVETWNMISLEKLPVRKTVKPFQAKFLTAIVQTSYLRPGSFTKYQTYFFVKK